MSQQKHHYYGSTIYGWAVGDTKEQVAKALAMDYSAEDLKRMRKDHGGVLAVVCRVNLPKRAHYSINNYMPDKITKEDGVNSKRAGEKVPIDQIERIRVQTRSGKYIAAEV